MRAPLSVAGEHFLNHNLNAVNGLWHKTDDISECEDFVFIRPNSIGKIGLRVAPPELDFFPDLAKWPLPSQVP